MNEGKCKDTMGHSLKKGDWVTVLPPQNTIWIARVEEISEGGLAIAIDKNNKGMTPAKVRVVLDITLNANPQMPVFPNLLKTLPPGSDDILDKIMAEIEKGNQSPPLT